MFDRVISNSFRSHRCISVGSLLYAWCQVLYNNRTGCCIVPCGTMHAQTESSAEKGCHHVRTER